MATEGMDASGKKKMEQKGPTTSPVRPPEMKSKPEGTGCVIY